MHILCPVEEEELNKVLMMGMSCNISSSNIPCARDHIGNAIHIATSTNNKSISSIRGAGCYFVHIIGISIRNECLSMERSIYNSSTKYYEAYPAGHSYRVRNSHLGMIRVQPDTYARRAYSYTVAK